MSRNTAVVNLTLDKSGQGLTLNWSESPGAASRSMTGSEMARFDDLANRVGEAEKSPLCANSPVLGTRLALGRALYELIDGPERALSQRLRQVRGAGAHVHLIVRLQADDPDLLSHHPAAHWRWELLADEQGHVGTRDHVSLAVQLGEQAAGAPDMLEHGILRVLFMAYSPANTEPELDYEGEEDLIAAALSDFIEQGRATIHVAEEGTVDELERRLKLDDYDVVHLSGHGVLRAGRPYLLMEDEEGQVDEVGPDRLWAALKRARTMPRLLMIASCHSAEARGDMPSLAAQLVALGAPSVVGWVRPVRDDVATLAARDLYERLCAGVNSAEAVAFARRELYEADRAATHPSMAWGTLHLVTHNPMGFQLAPDVQPSREEEQPMPGELYRFLDQQGQMRVLQHGFVGRRRELQRLVRLLRHGKEGALPRAGAYILGMKGVGKSCLAGRALDRHEQDVGKVGLVVLHGELTDHQVIEQFRLLALQWQDEKAQAILDRADDSVAQRVEKLLRSQWPRQRLVIVLDDFEQNLDLRPEGHARLRPQAAQLLGVLLPACRVERPKLLVTTTASFELPTGERDALAAIELGAFQPGSVRKLWYRGQAEQSDFQTCAADPMARSGRAFGPQCPDFGLGAPTHRRQDPAGGAMAGRGSARAPGELARRGG
ncbi:MAG: hypothetical protein ETSY1_22470 [Candidatus Entotheonella factor]|uniref:CHAT domain-containing protein n=1 Tax=Entotheonella factor TaxID=1429438 RepID=W4LHM6_ENTF1|nr:MAG: hypothetical protein ETSY1_22470 [Candidatus Entotheonella factor]